MITNTELEQFIKDSTGGSPVWTHKVERGDMLQISRELLCAREVIKTTRQHCAIFPGNDSCPMNMSLKAYDALCAPQEKTGEVGV